MNNIGHKNDLAEEMNIPMISATQAQSIVLAMLTRITDDGPHERFAVQSCEPSPRGDYWIIRCNSEDYVIHGKREKCYVGVNAYLVDIGTGNIELVGSAQSVENFLQDKYDAREAGQMHYILSPAFNRQNKPALINLRQRLACSLQSALALLAEENRQWFTGKRRVLINTQAILDQENIASQISLVEHHQAIAIDDSVWHIDEVKRILRMKARLIDSPTD